MKTSILVPVLVAPGTGRLNGLFSRSLDPLSPPVVRHAAFHAAFR